MGRIGGEGELRKIEQEEVGRIAGERRKGKEGKRKEQ